MACTTNLPDGDGRFDIAYAGRPARAIPEKIRGTQATGHVGVNASIWTEPPTPQLEALARDIGKGYHARDGQAVLGDRHLDLHLVDLGKDRQALRLEPAGHDGALEAGFVSVM